MKTIANKDNSVIMRVSEERAEILVQEGFRYVPKSMYKESNIGDKPKTNKTKTKANKMSKSAKRHLRKSGAK